MIDKNNVWLQKILPILKVSNWLCKKGVQFLITIIYLLDYITCFKRIIDQKVFPEKGSSTINFCLGRYAWMPYAIFVLCLLIAGALLYKTWRQRITWKILLPNICIFFLLWWGWNLMYGFIVNGCNGELMKF